MKKIFLFAMLFISFKVFAQVPLYPIPQALGSDSTNLFSKSIFWGKKGLVNGYYADTLTANSQRIKNYPWAQIVTDTGTVRLRNIDATKWITIGGVSSGSGNDTAYVLFQLAVDTSYAVFFHSNRAIPADTLFFRSTSVGSGSGLNIYNGDSSLSGPRTVNLNSNNLSFYDYVGSNNTFMMLTNSSNYFGYDIGDPAPIIAEEISDSSIALRAYNLKIPLINSGSLSDSILTRDASTGIVHAIDRSLLGGSQTLQQVFDVQSANALLNKDDTITVNSHTLFVGDAFGGQLNGLEIDPGQFSVGTAYSSSGNKSQITMASDGSGATVQLSATNQVGGFHSPTLFLSSSTSEGDLGILADSFKIQSGGYSSANSGDVWTLINPATGSGYWHPTSGGTGSPDTVHVQNIGDGTQLAWTNGSDTLFFKNQQAGYGIIQTQNTDSSITTQSDTAGAKATSSNTGYLSNIDWNTFTHKVDTIWRTPGVDSIKFKINGTTYEILDSLGSGGSSLTRQVITSGTTATVTGGNYVVSIDPSATIASFTLTMPASPSDLQTVEVGFGGTLTSGTIVTALTISANSGQTIIDNTPPESATADNTLYYRYRSSTSQWRRIKL